MKKILFKIWKFPGISETFILAQIATAIKGGYEVRVLLKDLPEALDKTIHKEFVKKYQLKDKLIFENLQIPQNKSMRLLKAGWLFILNLPNLYKVYRYFKHKDFHDLNHIYQFEFYKRFREYDLIHIEYGTNARPIDSLKQIGLLKAKLVVSFHGHDLFFPINGVIENKNYYKTLFESADKLVANTPYLGNLLVQLEAPEDKVIIIPVGVNNEFFTPPRVKEDAKQEIKLISIGRLVKFKGHVHGLKCIKNLIDKGYNVRYTIIGSGNQLEFLENSILDNGLKDVVQLLGKKNQKEIRDHLRTHDIFLMTSVEDPAYGVETQGLVTAEAQACGLPVIAFDSGGIKHTLEDGVTGFLVKEGDIIGMTEKIEILINDNNLRGKMSESAIHYINQKFSQQHIDKIWFKEYYQLLSN